MQERNHPPTEASRYDVVGVCASAGGPRALMKFVSGLPASFPVPIIVVQHLEPHHPTVLADILQRHTHLKVKIAEEDERLEASTVYVAPPDRHVIIASGPDRRLALSRIDPVHFARPSADVLFRSMAEMCGPRALAIVLTGAGVDGAAGVAAIKRMGGTVVAQDQATSDFFGMPNAAIHTGVVDQVLPLEAIAPALVALVCGEPR